MRFPVRLIEFSLSATALISVVANSQQLPHFPDTVASNIPQAEHIKLYNNAPGVTEPVPLPMQLPVLSTGCKGVKDSGTVT
jgi:hypothetical protein